MDGLQAAVGPTLLFLVVFSFYAFGGLWLAFDKQTSNHDIPSILEHTETIAGLIVPIGMIGTYWALVKVLSSGDIDFSAHMNALYSTLIALITYACVLIASEFIKRIKAVAATESGNTAGTALKGTLIMQQIEIAGFWMGACLFVYLALKSSGILST